MITSDGNRNPVNADFGGIAERGRAASLITQTCLDLTHGQRNRPHTPQTPGASPCSPSCTFWSPDSPGSEEHVEGCELPPRDRGEPQGKGVLDPIDPVHGRLCAATRGPSAASMATPHRGKTRQGSSTPAKRRRRRAASFSPARSGTTSTKPASTSAARPPAGHATPRLRTVAVFHNGPGTWSASQARTLPTPR